MANVNVGDASSTSTARNEVIYIAGENNGDAPEDTKASHDLFKSSEGLIFKKIEAKDHVGVEKLLANKCHKVDIVPKIGCSPHQYLNNIANSENESGDSPLILAARIDSKMVTLIVEYGGNPNHKNTCGDCPLSVAAERTDQASIDALLLAGADLSMAVRQLTSILTSNTLKDSEGGHDGIGFSAKPINVLLSNDVYLKCRDPIKAAFDVSQDIQSIEDTLDEFGIVFELLISDADVFAYKFLNHCDKMSEARELFGRPNARENLLKMSITQRRKKFVSHPYSQHMIVEFWYGRLAHTNRKRKIFIALQYVLSPVLLPLFFLKFLFIDICRSIPFMESSFSNLLRLLFTPYLCFITDAVNYIIFLSVMILVCVVPFGTYDVTKMEYVLYFSVLCRLVLELDFIVQQGWRMYFSNVWNFVDITILVLLTAAAIIKASIHYIVDSLMKKYDSPDWDPDDVNLVVTNLEILETELITQHKYTMIVNYIYAVTEFILTLRLLTLLELSKEMGPMLIALKRLIKEVIKFCILLFTCVMGAAIAVYSVTISLEEWNNEVNMEIQNATWYKAYYGVSYNFTLLQEVTIPEDFNSFTDCINNIMWSTFGLLDVTSIKISNDPATTNFLHLVMLLYVLLSCILLLNMLIGILSTTFDRVQENCDIEWKYVRSELLKEYSRAQPFLFPFFVLLFPFIIWFRKKLKNERKKKLKITADMGSRDKLLATLCQRFNSASRTEEAPLISEFCRGKTDTFARTVTLQKQQSLLRRKEN